MLRFLLPIAVLAALVATSLPAVAAAAEPAVAPPASARVAAACKQRSAAAEATKDQVTRVPRGDVALSGCVSDDSGIEAVVVRWASNDGDAHGRICTDPAVLDGQWRCSWDAGRLPLGAYDLELVAVDAAGNRGSSTRRYELIEPPAVPPTTTPEAGSGAVPLPAPSPEAEPQAEPDTAPEVTPTTPEAQPEPADPPEPVFSAIQQLVIDRVVVCERGGSDLRQMGDTHHLMFAAQGLQHAADNFGDTTTDTDIDLVKHQRRHTRHAAQHRLYGQRQP